MARHGTTWLHELHAGVALADRADFAGATARTRASLALRPTALALRNLAVLSSGSEDERFEGYRKAWDAAAKPSHHNDHISPRLRRNLASEISEVRAPCFPCRVRVRRDDASVKLQTAAAPACAAPRALPALLPVATTAR